MVLFVKGDPMITRELEVTLNLAVSEAARRRHEYVTLEHVLYALLHNHSAAKALRACGGSIHQVRQDVDQFFEKYLPENLPEGKLPQPTLAFQRVIQRAAQSVRSAGRDAIDGSSLLVALYSEPECHATFFLQNQDISRLDVLRFISPRDPQGWL